MRFRFGRQWRGQNARGAASLVVGASWCLGAAAGSLRPAATVRLVALTMAPLAWLAAAALHVALWTRRSAAPLLYLAIYWLLSAASAAGIIYQNLSTKASPNHIELYIQGLSMFLSLLISVVDSICFYDEVKYNHIYLITFSYR